MPSITIQVRATPGASKNNVGGAWVGPDGQPRLVVKVTAPPESGRANKAIEAVLASAFGLPKSAASVVSGTKNRLKSLRLDSSDEAAIKMRLEALLGETK